MDLTTRERAACREEFGASFDRMPDHPNVLTFVRGYRAGLASPSEEMVRALIVAAQAVSDIAGPPGESAEDYDYGGDLDAAKDSLFLALAALRTTKGGGGWLTSG